MRSGRSSACSVWRIANAGRRFVALQGDLLIPLINLLRDQRLVHDVLHMDETPLQVLKEAGKGYAGYNAVVAANGITHLACWAHACRKFIEVQCARTQNAQRADFE